MSLLILNPPRMGMALAHFTSLSRLQFSRWLFLNTLVTGVLLSYRFKQFSKVVVLQFSCDYDVIMGGGKHSFTYSDILTRTHV